MKETPVKNDKALRKIDSGTSNNHCGPQENNPGSPVNHLGPSENHSGPRKNRIGPPENHAGPSSNHRGTEIYDFIMHPSGFDPIQYHFLVNTSLHV